MTTITHALNQSSAFYGYTVNSPLPESSFPNWDYVDGYEVVVSGAMFGQSGFGHVEIPLVHNSPPKTGMGAVNPVPCAFCITNIAVVTAQMGLQSVSGSAQAVVCISTNRTAAIGDLVWSDLNGNGVRDAGEPGVSNVTVNLTDCSGHLLRSAITDPAGAYLFSGMIPGNYKVQFIAPAGASFTTANAGLDDTLDSDADGVTGLSACVSLAVGEINRTVDAGLLIPVQPIIAQHPAIYWPEFLADGHVLLRTDGTPGANYSIEASSDLVHWSSVGTITNQGGLLDFVDPGAVNASQRFYRLVLAP
jgi:hypothetical protein